MIPCAQQENESYVLRFFSDRPIALIAKALWDKPEKI